MVKRLAVVTLAVVLGLAVMADAGQGTGRIAGTARNAQNQILPNVKVQLRNVDTGQLVATTRAAGDGRFEFTGLNPGNYLVEIVDDDGRIIGLSPSLALAAGGVISGVMIAASAAGALAGAVATAGGIGAFFTTTGGILLLAGVGAGVTAGVIALTNEASPSR
jgi:hypothetical protein